MGIRDALIMISSNLIISSVMFAVVILIITIVIGCQYGSAVVVDGNKFYEPSSDFSYDAENLLWTSSEFGVIQFPQGTGRC